jgi:hypothetical protein
MAGLCPSKVLMIRPKTMALENMIILEMSFKEVIKLGPDLIYWCP